MLAVPNPCQNPGLMRPSKEFVELGMLLVVIVGFVGGIWNRIKLSKGIGLRFIQYFGLVVIIPVAGGAPIQNLFANLSSPRGRLHSSQRMTPAMAGEGRRGFGS